MEQETNVQTTTVEEKVITGTAPANYLLTFFNTINTPGGHIFICICLLGYYAQFHGDAGLPHDIAIFALGVLSRSMGGRNSNEPTK